MGIKFANNASTNITHALAADAISVSVTPGTGDLFPSIVEGKDYFYATLAGNSGLEIVKVTRRILDTMTIERAQDGTNALLFNQGDLFELRIVAADFEDTFSHVETTLEDTVDALNTSVNNKLSSYLPLEGGRITGPIFVAEEDYSYLAARSRNDDQIIVCGGGSASSGGTLRLYGKDYTSCPGRCALTVTDGTVNKAFTVDVNGSIKWDGYDLLSSKGGLLSGTFIMDGSNALFFRRNNHTGMVVMRSGSDGTSSQIVMCGKEESSSPGRISLQARKGTELNTLNIESNGTATLAGNAIITSSGGNINGRLTINNSAFGLNDSAAVLSPSANTWHSGAIEWTDKNGTKVAFIQPLLRSNKSVTLHFRINNGTTERSMEFNTTGTLTISGKRALTTDDLPAGTVIPFAGNSTPSGYLICNGAAVSRTTYSALFSAIGTTYGTGDGSTTFNLPNLTDKFIQGSGTAGTVKAAGLPDHKHLFTHTQSYAYSFYGSTAFYTTEIQPDFGNGKHHLDAARSALGNASGSNSIYGKSTTVQPPALTMRYYIKY